MDRLEFVRKIPGLVNIGAFDSRFMENEVNKMGKNANGPLGASHACDTPIWFTLAVPEGIDSLLNFINTLDPNRPAKDSTSNISIPWTEVEHALCGGGVVLAELLGCRDQCYCR
ncbi:hypothetical protein B0H14DRAFT_3436578 [Mycena olivaceomarginata]|nr:hypothetical protein B0H14DRAFT_3436578 [Mycena olivaceomarginata]